MPRMGSARWGSSRIARVVLAMLSAPRVFSTPMARLRRVARARGAVPAWTVEASSAKVTSLMWCEEFAGDGVDTLTGLALAGGLAAAVDADGQAGVGKGDSAEFVGDTAGLDRAGLAASVSGPGGGVLDCDGLPGQSGELGVGGGLVGLDHGDVVGLLGFHQPGDVRLDRVQGVEGDDGAGQVQRCQQRPEVRGFVRLRADLHLGEGHEGAVGDRGEQMPARRGETG